MRVCPRRPALLARHPVAPAFFVRQDEISDLFIQFGVGYNFKLKKKFNRPAGRAKGRAAGGGKKGDKKGACATASVAGLEQALLTPPRAAAKQERTYSWVETGSQGKIFLTNVIQNVDTNQDGGSRRSAASTEPPLA